jgi:hypothetical protein
MSLEDAEMRSEESLTVEIEAGIQQVEKVYHLGFR